MNEVIDYTVMNAKVIGSAAKRLKVEAKGDLVSKAHALMEHFKKTAARAKSDLYACTACGGLSDDGWPKCPYCGGDMADDDGIIEDEEAARLKVEAKANGAAKVNEALDTLASGLKVIETTSEVVATLDDLDASVKKIGELRESAAASIWELGQAIRHNFERELWKLRLKEGKVAYTNYKKFVAEELGMSHTMAFNLMEVARQFSKEDVAAVGVTKLSIIAKVNDPEKRAALLEGARNGASVRETQQQAKGEDDADTKGPVTFVARTDGVQTFPMKRANDGEPATRLEAGVWAEEEHENGVVSAYSVEVEGDAVVLRVNRYRG